MGKSKRVMPRRRRASRKNMKGGFPFPFRGKPVSEQQQPPPETETETEPEPAAGDWMTRATNARDAFAASADGVTNSLRGKAAAAYDAAGVFSKSTRDTVPDSDTDSGSQPIMQGGTRTRRRGMYKRSRRSKTFKDLCSNIGNVVLPYGLLGIKKCSSRKKRSGRSRKYRHKR